jgi:hypothetical protein
MVLGIPSALVFLAACKLTNGRRLWLSLAAGVLMLPIFHGCISFLWPETEEVHVVIESPQQGAAVEGDWIVVKGTVNPPGTRVVLLAHPCRDVNWWVQPDMKVVGGAWKCEANLGTSAKGGGECFQLLAVASRDPWLVDILKESSLWKRGTCPRPPRSSNSPVVTVWRSQ